MSHFPPLTIPYRVSPQLVLLNVAVHAVVAGLLVFAPAQGIAKLVGALLFLVGGCFTLFQFYKLKNVSALYVEEGRVSVEFGGRKVSASLDGTLVMTSVLIILPLRLAGHHGLRGRLFLPLLKDSIGEEFHRQLRVLIRCGELSVNDGM